VPIDSPYTALKLISEVGVDMSRWRTEKHFVSWLSLSPDCKISGGKLLGSATRPSANRAANTFRLAAFGLIRSDNALAAFYRRMAARIGKAKAVIATARKLAILFYRALKGDIIFDNATALQYEEAQRNRALKSLKRRASILGLRVVEASTAETFT
jgi:hypothetical protein